MAGAEQAWTEDAGFWIKKEKQTKVDCVTRFQRAETLHPSSFSPGLKRFAAGFSNNPDDEKAEKVVFSTGKQNMSRCQGNLGL